MRGQGYGLAAVYRGKNPVHIVQEAGWVPVPDWSGAENLAPTGIRSTDRPPVASRYTYKIDNKTK